MSIVISTYIQSSTMTSNNDIHYIKMKWTEIENEIGIFRYNLLNVKGRYLKGKYNFFAELNTERYRLRRIPQHISSLNATFVNDVFNFNNINPREKLLDVPYEGSIFSFIINQSPLTKYHSLICPDLKKLLPQKMTHYALEFCINFLLDITDRDFRIGYNSPGALASVNHLHFHLLHINRDLYIDNALLQNYVSGYAYCLHNDMPTEAICFIVDKKNKIQITKTVVELIDNFCLKCIPHNMFITPDRTSLDRKLKIFIFAREKFCLSKNLTNFNIAFCELSGYIPIGDESLYHNITEDAVIEQIRKLSGNIYTFIYELLTKDSIYFT